MLVLQSTSFCNIDCAYCYLPSRSDKARMGPNTIERVFDGLTSSPFLSDHLTVLWHAGEPTTLGIAYYERAFAIIRDRLPRNIAVKHNIQTNGTLIDQAWCEFFRDNDICVGLSIDGPKHLHDRYRKTRAKLGTYDQVMRGVHLLNENKIPFHVITVLTADSLRSARELFNFYVEIGATNVGFNIEEVEGTHVSSSLQNDQIETEARNFFEEFYELCEARPNKLRVREFDGAFTAITNSTSHEYGNPLTEPLRMLSVSATGDLSTFSPELLGYGSDRHGSFVFGNINKEQKISSLLENSNFRLVNAEIERGLANCEKKCEYFELCRGGAPANKFFENGTFDSTETLFCRLTKKAVIDVVLTRLEAVIGTA